MTLRFYQEEALDRALWAKKLEGGSVISLPVGAGKSFIIAELAKRLREPVLIFAPSKELLEQDYEKLSLVVPREEIGVFSASKGVKQTGFYTLATIQSAHKRPDLFSSFKTVIIDECHQVNAKNEQSMYMSFLTKIRASKVFGFTATPFRMETFSRRITKGYFEHVTTIKMITRTAGGMWKNLLYHKGYAELLSQGYLSPLEYKTKQEIAHERLKLNATRSDFDLVWYDQYMQKNEPLVVSSLVDELQSGKRKKALVFCSTIEQANRLQEKTQRAIQSSTGSLNKRRVFAETISAKTPMNQRDAAVRVFKNADASVLFNVQCLTTGFDAPDIDLIVSLRPTRSVGLWMQMLGRGTRKAEGKQSCVVYDFSGNTRSIGALHEIAIQKINNKWDVATKAFPGGVHNQEIYAFQI